MISQKASKWYNSQKFRDYLITSSLPYALMSLPLRPIPFVISDILLRFFVTFYSRWSSWLGNMCWRRELRRSLLAGVLIFWHSEPS